MNSLRESLLSQQLLKHICFGTLCGYSGTDLGTLLQSVDLQVQKKNPLSSAVRLFQLKGW